MSIFTLICCIICNFCLKKAENKLKSGQWWPVWPDLAFLDFGQLFKAFRNKLFAQFLDYFCKGVKIIHFSSEIIFEQLLLTFGDFYLVTLVEAHIKNW